MEIKTFIKEFADDFEFSYDVLKINSTKNNRSNKDDFKNLLPHEIVSFILKVLITQRQYILGIVKINFLI